MSKFYMIRTQTCPNCGLSEFRAAASSVAGKFGFSFIYVTNTEKQALDLIEEWDGLKEAFKESTCVLFNDQTGNYTSCTQNRNVIEALFNE